MLLVCEREATPRSSLPDWKYFLCREEYRARPGKKTDRDVLEGSEGHFQKAGWFPLFRCQGQLICTFKNRITLLLQYCQGKKREREAEEREVPPWSKRACEHAATQESTSDQEYGVDA